MAWANSHIFGDFTVVHHVNGMWQLDLGSEPRAEDLGDEFVPGTAAWDARWRRYDALADAEAARIPDPPLRARIGDCLGDWLGAFMEFVGDFAPVWLPVALGLAIVWLVNFIT